MSGPLLALLLGCGSGPALPASELPPVDLRVFLDGEQRGNGGVLVVQTTYDPDGELRVAQPVAEGMDFQPDGPPTTESIGERDVVTQRYVFRASKGSYEVPPLLATWTAADGAESQAESRSVFVDVGVEPPEVGELVDIVEPPPVRTIPWVPILTVGGLFAGGLLLAFAPRRRKAEVTEPPPSPDVVALRAWEAVRDDPSLTDEDKAREVSRIFREYTEAVLGFEASAWTTSEIVAQLEGLARLPDGNVPRAKRLLRATDRIKFAEERPAGELVAELDADLRAFVESTRPGAWRVPDKAAAPPRPKPQAGAFDPFEGDAAWAELTYAVIDHACASVEEVAAGTLIPFFMSVDGAGARTLTRVVGGDDYDADVAEARRMARAEGRRPWALAYERDDAIYAESVGAAGAMRLTFAQRYHRDLAGTLVRDGEPAVVRMDPEGAS